MSGLNKALRLGGRSKPHGKADDGSKQVMTPSTKMYGKQMEETRTYGRLTRSDSANSFADTGGPRYRMA